MKNRHRTKTHFTAAELTAFAPVIAKHHARVLAEAAAGKSDSDIAALFVISIGTVKSRLNRARGAMNRAIENAAAGRPPSTVPHDSGDVHPDSPAAHMPAGLID